MNTYKGRCEVLLDPLVACGHADALGVGSCWYWEPLWTRERCCDGLTLTVSWRTTPVKLHVLVLS